MSTESSIRLNEFYGVTIQGEGPDIGRACLFIRTQNCPVKCPGCDSYYTWDGSEQGNVVHFRYLRGWLNEMTQKFPGIGLVLTGGEPLLHFRNQELVHLVNDFRYPMEGPGRVRWAGLETSGFIGKAQTEHRDDLKQFLSRFSTVCVSPKVTPCLRGEWATSELLANFQLILILLHEVAPNTKPCIKFVVRDTNDLQVVKDIVKSYAIPQHWVYLMPFGIQDAEVAESCRNLVPVLAETGYTLSPRLHTLLWGNTRAI